MFTVYPVPILLTNSKFKYTVLVEHAMHMIFMILLHDMPMLYRSI